MGKSLGVSSGPREAEAGVVLENLNLEQQAVVQRILLRYSGPCTTAESGYWDLMGVKIELKAEGVRISHINSVQVAMPAEDGRERSLMEMLVNNGLRPSFLGHDGTLSFVIPFSNKEMLNFESLTVFFGEEVAGSFVDIVESAEKLDEADDMERYVRGKLLGVVSSGGSLDEFRERLEKVLEKLSDNSEEGGASPDLERMNEGGLLGDYEDFLNAERLVLSKRMKLQSRMSLYMLYLLGKSDKGRDFDDESGLVGSGEWDLTGADFRIEDDMVFVNNVISQQFTRDGVRLRNALELKGIDVQSTLNSKLNLRFDLRAVLEAISKLEGLDS